jgi:hypothetical protein
MAVVLTSAMGFTSASQATPLTGDQVTVDLNGFLVGGTVGAGTDITLFSGNVLLDFNAGVDGDVFQLSAGRDFPSVISTGDLLTIELGDLDFLGGEILVGFADLFSVFADTTFSITDHSILFSMTDGPGDAGVILSGRFVTRPVAVAVPEPTTLSLFALGAGFLGLIAWRRRRSESSPNAYG